MTNINKTIKELNDILTYLKGKVDSTTTYDDATEKTAWEKRITELKNNDPTHQISLPGLAAFEADLAKQITELIKDKTELEAAKKLVETERNNKQSLLTTKESELTAKEAELQAKINEITGLKDAKLTKEVVDKINALSNDSDKLGEMKNALDEMKSSLAEVKKASQALPPNWAGYTGFAVSIISCLILAYQSFFKNEKKEKKALEIEE